MQQDSSLLTFSQRIKPKWSKRRSIWTQRRGTYLYSKNLSSLSSDKTGTCNLQSLRHVCRVDRRSKLMPLGRDSSEIVEHRSHDSRAIMMADRHTGSARLRAVPVYSLTRHAAGRNPFSSAIRHSLGRGVIVPAESPSRGQQRRILQTEGRHISFFFSLFSTRGIQRARAATSDAGSPRVSRHRVGRRDRYQFGRDGSHSRGARRNPVCMSVAVARHPPTHARTTAFRFCWLLRRRSAAHPPGVARPRGRAPRAPEVRVPGTSRSLRNGTATGSRPRRWKTPHGRDTCVSLHPASSPRVRRRHGPPVSNEHASPRAPAVRFARAILSAPVPSAGGEGGEGKKSVQVLRSPP